MPGIKVNLVIPWHGIALMLVTSVWLAAACKGEVAPEGRPGVDNIYGAAMEGNLKQVKTFVADHPELVNAKNESGMTALHLAAWKGQTEVVKFLLERGANVNIAERNGDTALHFAASWGYLEVCKLLIARGANVNARNNEGKTPLSRVNPPPSKQVVTLLRQHGGVE